MIRITLKRSLIGRPERQRRIIKALGLRRLNHSVLHRDTPSIRGMINKVPHMLKVEEIGEKGGEVTVDEIM
ncbi:MAG: 50S ribosomal protein L30 [Thermodesulfovibrionia bacterium]